MARSSTLARLAAARPARLTAVDQARRRRDLARILATAIEPAGPTAARRRPRPGPLGLAAGLAAGLAIAAAVAVTATVVTIPRTAQAPSGGRQAGGPATPAAERTPAAFLAASAERLLAAPAPAARPGQYWYERTRTQVLSSINAYLPPDRMMRDPVRVLAEWGNQHWYPAGRGMMHGLEYQHQTFEFLDPAARARWKAAGSPKLNVLRNGVGGASAAPVDGLQLGIPLAEFLDLDPDPARLTARIRELATERYPPGGERVLERAEGGKPRPGDRLVRRLRPLPPDERERRIAQAMFATATTWLRYSQHRPALQAALYGVLGGIPGVRYVGPVTDNEGRHGEAVGLVSEAGDGSVLETRVVIDPATGRLLAEQQYVVRAAPDSPARAQPAGTLSYSEAYLEGRWSGRPAGGWPANPPGVSGPKG